MADRYYSANPGSGMSTDVTETATSTAGARFEFRVTYDAASVDKTTTVKALEAIMQTVIKDTFPPV